MERKGFRYGVIRTNQMNPSITDRHGFTYEQRKATQARQLAEWAVVLRPEVLESAMQIIDMLDKPALNSAGLHSVVLGSDLASLFRAYPKHSEMVEKIMLDEMTFIPAPTP